MPKFVHALPDAKSLFETLGAEKNLPPILIEKDYWAMHCLWGLQQSDFRFEMKGGTSLSKGWGCIDRFSEDIDIRFESPTGLNVKAEKPSHIKARFAFYDSLAQKLKSRASRLKGIEPMMMRRLKTAESALSTARTLPQLPG